MPTRTYDLEGDSSSLVRSLTDATRAMADALEEANKLEKKTQELNEQRKREAEAADKAKKKNAELAAKHALVLKGVTGLIGGVTALTAAYVAQQNEIAKNVQEFDRFSVRTGIQTETLQGLKAAAQSAGLELDELVPEDLAVRIKEAAEGTGEGAAAFELLDIKARNANGTLRDGNEVFRELLDRLAAMEDRTLAAALADDLFSDAGTNLIGVLDGGSAELDRFNQRIRVYGTEITPEAAEQSRQWTAALGRLKDALGGATNEVVTGITPAATNLADNIAFLTLALRSLVEVGVGGLINNVAALKSFLSGDIGFEELRERTVAGSEAFAELNERMREFAEAGQNLDPEPFVGPIQAGTGAIVENTKATKANEEATKAAADAAKERAEAEAEAQANIARAAEQAVDIRIRTLGEQADAVREFGEGVIREKEKETEAFEKELEKQKEAQREAFADLKEARLDFTNAVLDAVQRASQAVSGIFKETAGRIDDQQDLVAERLDEISKMQEEQRDAAIVLEEQGLQARKVILAAQEREVRKGLVAAFIAEKSSALSAIAINTAVAITNALAQLGPIAGGFAAGAVATTGAIQAGIVGGQSLTLHDGGPMSRPNADESTFLGRLTRAGEGLFVANQRATETLDRANRDQPMAGGTRPMMLVLENAGRAVGEALLFEADRPGSPLQVAGSMGAVDPYRRVA